ncbi:MAG: GNAT family N-acetyltransferase [Candidatus Eremiobacteraeota bacterium]|nr:GNAT family N-acetyltransferase [Candidatus Eremiobacteraeota bacterium]MBV8366437.1 GNAT family N-acetyltransferase [Candidatus Eremiobacteraeota bacterium]
MHIETARLVIRTSEPRDAQAWLAMINDPQVKRFLPAGPDMTLDSYTGVLERRRKMEEERGYTLWSVELKETGAFIGQCGLFPAEGKGPEIEIAYHYNTASWNKGYGTEAAIAVLDHAFRSVGLDDVIAIVMPGNVGSCRVVEKAGMRFTGLATYYHLPDLRRYEAQRVSWTPPQRSTA